MDIVVYGFASKSWPLMYPRPIIIKRVNVFFGSMLVSMLRIETAAGLTVAGSAWFRAVPWTFTVIIVIWAGLDIPPRLFGSERNLKVPVVALALTSRSTRSPGGRGRSSPSVAE